jgi:hypothetical protein
LQALTLLNDPVYVEAALALAKRILREQPDASSAGRIEHAFRICLSRRPTLRELAFLERLHSTQLKEVRQQIKEGRKTIGMDDLPEHVTAEELAAWYSVASVLLNLDESITKE